MSQSGRREFLLNALRMSGQITVASSAIYSISLFNSGGKFGGLTAGAKCYDICGVDQPIGTILPACGIFIGGPQNVKQNYKCNIPGWQTQGPGTPVYIAFCPDPGPC